MIKYIL